MTVTDDFRAARDRLLELRLDYQTAREEFRWPHFEEFNFALDWFDSIATDPATSNRPALVIVEKDGSALRRSYSELSRRSSQVANWLRAQGARRGDRMILMLGNQVELWETMLAGIKLGLVLIPTTPQMGPADLADRVQRGEARWALAAAADLAKFATVPGDYRLISVGAEFQGALSYSGSSAAAEEFLPEQATQGSETLLLYFTSGTTSQAKLVEHTHTSYPVGHLSTMYWIGLEPGDVHLNVASPGWAKHAWSNIFTPWIAEACVFIYNYDRFDAKALMAQMDAERVTSFCAPPTVWRLLIQADLSQLKNPPQKVVSAGEPLNAEVIEQVRRAWGQTIRDGFGQTESTVQIANTPGQEVTIGAMGRPLPGYHAVLVDPLTGAEGNEGELCLRLGSSNSSDPGSASPRSSRYGRPVGLMKGYYGDVEKTDYAFRDGYYHTGDMAERDASGVITYIGRDDDVFKSSDYKLSPFELESVLIEHPAVAEAAVVPSPDPLKLSVPKAFVVLAPGYPPSAETAEEILRYCREQLPPFKRIRRLEFSELPKTISGKIRRVELRRNEALRHSDAPLPEGFGVEYSEADFPGIKESPGQR
ncbi:AMP-binding protein [Psychromicrobium sp. YIM B11713]|uniref:AMP-binding protein n=1 Tax=Psychromicrobium sp. YIM B11713 TaxID=3145233 RepID=UPI00374F67B5